MTYPDLWYVLPPRQFPLSSPPAGRHSRQVVEDDCFGRPHEHRLREDCLRQAGQRRCRLDGLNHRAQPPQRLVSKGSCSSTLRWY